MTFRPYQLEGLSLTLEKIHTISVDSHLLSPEVSNVTQSWFTWVSSGDHDANRWPLLFGEAAADAKYIPRPVIYLREPGLERCYFAQGRSGQKAPKRRH